MVACGVVFAFILGAGLLGAQATGAVVRLQDGGAWLANVTQGTVTWVNGYAGQAGKTVPIGALSAPFHVVQRPDGAYAVDGDGNATLIDGAQLEASERPHQLPSGVQILATGTATWMLDTTKHQVQRLDPKSLDPLGAAVPVAGVTRAVVDDQGFLWAAVPSQGVVLRIGEGAVGRTEVGRAGENLTVAADEAGEHVIAVNTTAGSTFSLHGEGEARSFSPLPAGSGPAGLQVAVDHDGSVLVGLDGRAVVVPAHGEGRAGTLPEGTKVDQVEIVSGTGYVVDHDSDQLVRVDLGSGAGTAVPNVGGDDLDDVEAHGNLLYLNDSGGNQVKVVKPDGVIVPIEKYRPGQKPAKPSVKTPPTSSASTSSPNRDPQKGSGGKKSKKKTSDQGDPSPGPKTTSGKPSAPANSPDPGDDAGPTTSPTTSPSESPTPETTTPSPTPNPDGPPEAPAIKALTAEDGQALVEWSAAADRGSAVTGYSIVIDNQLVQEVDADQLSFRLTKLTNGQKYGVQVRALSAAGEGDLSKIWYVTPSADLPGTPGGVAATALDAEIRVTWNAADAGPRSAVNGYTITVTGPDGTRKTQEVTGLQGSVTGLTNGTGYLVEVSARSTGGVGEPGKPAAGQPGSTEQPAVPSGKPGQVAVQAPKNGNGSAVITWTAAPDAGSAITGYEVQVGGGAVQQVGTKLTYTAPNLTNDVDTTIQVRAVNKNGQGPWSSVKAHPTVPRKTIYQCKSLQVADIWMLNLTTNCNSTVTRWNPATTIFKAPSSQQPGSVKLVRCERSTDRGIIRQQLEGCPSGSETDNMSFWAWKTQHAGATQIVEWHYASEGNQGGYYYAPSGQSGPSGFSKTGRSFWV